MPVVEWFAYCFPNRRTDKPVVEITLKFKPADQHVFPKHSSEIKDILVSNGILKTDECFPEQALPKDHIGWYTSLLVQTALLFQRKTGHRVNYYSVSCDPEQNRSIALLEHEHCDVGMTAVKLAIELVTGKRRLLAEPFQRFTQFALERLLPLETEAIIKAANRRDIPCIQLERQPYKREDFEHLTGGRCLRRNGLLMLGYGVHQHILDGTYCLDKAEDFNDISANQGQNRTSVENAASSFTESTANDLLNWLFPEKNNARMPVIAVTGTNGKTTTTRMISHILMHAGLEPGMVCTDGVFLNGQQVSEGDQCTDTGHFKVLTSKQVKTAVLETHHAGILCRGFAFGWCDIAVCLNVTADHLGVANVNTVEQMGMVKQALPERARKAVVLNADDPYCLNMLSSMLAEKTCLVSMECDVDELRELTDNGPVCFCVLESINNAQWLVIYDQGKRSPLMDVSSIPATFSGTASFNISNSMHAVAASYLVDVKIEKIVDAMRNFRSGPDSTPGRLNIFNDLPFRVIIDFAHNADGFLKLSEFINTQPVSGRKILVFGISDNGRDEAIKAAMSGLAGHFDHYVCVDCLDLKYRQVGEIPALLASGLRSAGVAKSDISLVLETNEWWHHGLDMVAPGDLLVLIPDPDEVRTIWDLLRSMAATVDDPH
jgi:UDP-N-acetylmuramyl tripeptide synthase